jgi:hypothetical protein
MTLLIINYFLSIHEFEMLSTFDLGLNIKFFFYSVDIISKLPIDVIHVIKSPNMGFFGMINIQSEV